MSQTIPHVSEAKVKVLQANYGRLKRQDDPRTHGPAGQRYPDTRDGRIQWARDHMGRQSIQSFFDLTTLDADYLLDMLNGKPTKLDQKLQQLITAARIRDIDAWFNAVAKRNLWKFRRVEFHQLNRYQKWLLCEMLSSRTEPQPPVQGCFDFGGATHADKARVPRGNH